MQTQVIEALSEQLTQSGWVKLSAGKKAKADTAMGQLEKAKAWLYDHPDLSGLSQREAAKKAGVGLATLQRAISAKNNAQQQLL